MINPTSKSELLNAIKASCVTESPSKEDDILSVLSYYTSLLLKNNNTSESSSYSYHRLFYDDSEIMKHLKKLLLQSMTAQGSPLHDKIRSLSYEVFALLLENSQVNSISCCNSWDWLIVDENIPEQQQSSRVNTKVGKALCAMLTLTVGELRIELGRVLLNNKHDDEIQSRTLVVWYCTRIILAFMSQLIELMAEEDDDDNFKVEMESKSSTSITWENLSFNAILSIKKLLDDAHDSMFQYLAECSRNNNEPHSTIAILCAKCIGAWLSETSIDEVTTSRDIVYEAICSSVSLSNKTLHPRDINKLQQMEKSEKSMIGSSEPLEYIFPAIFHISSQEKKKSLSKKIRSSIGHLLHLNEEDKVLLDYLSQEFPMQTLLPYLNRILSILEKSLNNNEEECLVKSLIWVFILFRKFKKKYKSYDYNSKLHNSILKSVNLLVSKLHRMVSFHHHESPNTSISSYADVLRYAVQSFYIFHPRDYPNEQSIVVVLQFFQKMSEDSVLDKKVLENLVCDYKKYRELSLQYQSWYELDVTMVKFEIFVNKL